ncbi:4-hydroxyphenylpyruvate dioxygenase [Aphanomyces astaci]|uniref:4-hydroxyphenylpyruvate dioxygenase n=2 Tax=Aphanomyces astaci TaxID=112090 RepID=W4GXB9_APHAT|nr:4-hydroxyphenylpyruvate dioxygenase [Aphanomyces astaci]ETV83981.1 4-hydroxyphenylpyruvate dioxygenase [Aphanomyces astaci]|eukprot:XP_009825673.1 4-hydroxyphenylpyruvate dioxygenase [Aphanomyces astaci]
MASTTAAPSTTKMQLVGFKNFVRHNPKSDRFTMHKFHHVEFYCQDATNVSKRFGWGAGLNLVAKSDQSTGNHAYASYVMQSGDLQLVITAPYSRQNQKTTSTAPLPHFDVPFAHEFCAKHGLAVRAMGISVEDAKAAYDISVANGGEGVTPPQELTDAATGQVSVVSEVKLYGEVVLRFVSGNFAGRFLPGYENVEGPDVSIGLQRLDHAVGNLPNLLEAMDYVCGFTGWHEYAEFTAEDVGTVDSGLNSMVLANNTETILLPMNEPTFGTKRKSQIQTFLEQNEGPGLQHMALKTNDIFHTLAEMRKRTHLGGFDFMPKPSAAYYKNLPAKIGDVFTAAQYEKIEQLGLLVDKDDQGILLQIFTKPLGDRPTCFFEIIERVGCMEEIGGRLEQAAGCGGFGKGNFSELFKSIEEYERTLDV